MAKRNKRKGNGKRPIKRVKVRESTNDEVAQESAAVLTCATKAAHEFVVVGEHYIKDLECDIPYLQVALEIWAEHPELALPLKSTLQELLQLLTTHCQTLKDINKKLEILAADPGPDIHLGAIDHYSRLINERLFPASSAS
jgi:hypothetical protein